MLIFQCTTTSVNSSPRTSPPILLVGFSADRFPSELSAEPIRADSLIFLESSDLILHLEFQTTTDENMPLRMLDYWVRIRRRFPAKQIHQTVIYLKPTNSPLAYQDIFISDQTILRTKLKVDKPVLAKLGVLGMGFNQGLV